MPSTGPSSVRCSKRSATGAAMWGTPDSKPLDRFNIQTRHLRCGNRGRQTPASARRARVRPEHRGTYVRVTSDGSPYARFRRALDLGRLPLVYAAAAELPRVDLDDALEVCVLMARDGHPAFERAAVRWVARLCLEQRVGIHDARCALALFETLPEDPHGAVRSLRALAAGRPA